MNTEISNKDKWVALFREIGLDDETMAAWHTAFEKKHPELHQSFLEWLGIPEDQIQRIRNS